MAHLSDGGHLRILHASFHDLGDTDLVNGFADVCVMRLPSATTADYTQPLDSVGQIVSAVATKLGQGATLIVLGEVVDLVHCTAQIPPSLRYQCWIAIKRKSPLQLGSSALPNNHFGALIYTKYETSLRHSKTRIEYTYCPSCDKTTKDYGGKKHTYHEFGTLMSDVWRDTACDFNGDLDKIYSRFADLFGVESYEELLVVDLRPLRLQRIDKKPPYDHNIVQSNAEVSSAPIDRLIVGDCLEKLKELPANSIDFAFADPPYNLGKRYHGYSDDLTISAYFDWCDAWIDELSRVLRPGRTCAILNIPLWAIRHFLHLGKTLTFQNWIVWDALSFPVRYIMPSHYAIVCFSKGISRDMPGLIEFENLEKAEALNSFDPLHPLAENFCLRTNCVKERKDLQINDRAPLTDLWWDIHRLKHNIKRVDHPCQLPPQLMYRLISIFTRPNEVVLDCFNGAGTTTLAAQQLGRHYIGIEISEQYSDLASSRHKEILDGINPFRNEEKELTSKNSPVPRLPKQKYQVSKKALQLEVKRIALMLGHTPNREEVKTYGGYPIEFYDKYFVSWGEVCAAARTTGMKEERSNRPSKSKTRQTTFA